MTSPLTTARWWKVSGPIVLSACSLFITALFLEPLARFLSPDFSFFASRGVGKFALSIMVLFQLALFLLVYSITLLKRVIATGITPFTSRKFFAPLLIFFSLFFFLHLSYLFILFLTHNATYHPMQLTSSHLFSMLFGLFVTFLLGWSEEFIFRAITYQYIAQFYRPLPSILLTSIIFTLVHDLYNPLNLLTTHLSLGVGLFLLGILLNLIFYLTNSLPASIGAHMGLVYVKVILRRARFLTFSPADLRQSPLIHLLFLLSILFLIYYNRNKLLKKPTTSV